MCRLVTLALMITRDCCHHSSCSVHLQVPLSAPGQWGLCPASPAPSVMEQLCFSCSLNSNSYEHSCAKAWPCDWEWAVKACGRACHTLGHHHMGKWVRELAATGCLGGKNLSCIHDAVKSLTRPARTPQLSAKTVIGWYQTCFGPEPKKTFVGWALTILLSVICPFLCLQAGGQVTLIAIGAYKGRLLSVSGTGPGELHWFSLATGRY